MAIYTTTVTRKGQVTIPIDIRRSLGLAAGERVDIEQQDDAVLLRRATSVADRTAGMLAKYRRPTPLTPEQERTAFEQAVADEVTARLGT